MRKFDEGGQGLFVIDPRNKAPLYEQLAQQLRWQIAMGFLTGDEPLPSVRQLSAELGINPNTIQKAYRLMEQEGLIYTLPGRGNFVTPAVTEQRRKQQEAQLALLEKELKRAREMGIEAANLLALVRKAYEEKD